MATYYGVISKNGVFALPAAGDIFKIDGSLGVNTTTAGGTPTATPSTFLASAGVLGTTLDNDINLGGFKGSTANVSYLNFHLRRTTASGSDWTTADWGICCDVDNTVMAGSSIWLGQDIKLKTPNNTVRWTIENGGNLTAAAMTQVINAGLIGTNSATSLIFRTNTATRWTIDTSGNLTAATGSIYLPSGSSLYTNSVLTLNNGVLASDTVHGSRGNGSLHTVATTGTAGFMSSTDKTKLDGIEDAAARSWVIFAGYAAGPTSTNTVYLCPGGMDDTSPKATRMDMPVPYACTITSVWIQCATGCTGGSWYVAIRKNASGTNLGSPVTLSAGVTSGSRGTESISLAQGDYICVACVGNGGTTVGASQICVSLAISHA